MRGAIICRRVFWVGAACGLLFGLAVSVPADDSNATGINDSADTQLVPLEPVSVDDWNPCPDLPLGAIPLEYRIVLRRELAQSRLEPLRSAHGTEDDHAFPLDALYDRMVIGSEYEYRELSGGLTTDIDWETSRILVVEEFTSYKFDTLDGDVRLSGIYESGESVIVSQTSANYGPCQGIAQDPDWFSFEISYLLIVLPREPATINYHWCSVGGCPPDIP